MFEETELFSGVITGFRAALWHGVSICQMRLSLATDVDHVYHGHYTSWQREETVTRWQHGYHGDSHSAARYRGLPHYSDVGLLSPLQTHCPNPTPLPLRPASLTANTRSAHVTCKGQAAPRSNGSVTFVLGRCEIVAVPVAVDLPHRWQSPVCLSNSLADCINATG